MNRSLVACTALTAALCGAPVATAAPGTCWETTATAAAEGGVPWEYLHRVKWCGGPAGITSVSPPTVQARPTDPTCEWRGVRETGTSRAGDSWESFSTGEFTCRDAAGEPHQVNPWVVVVVHPDGSHDVDRGVAGA
ncbi:hypothetical protein AB0I60_06040 [Actinosynnema sp. NPDC050436]|uniref:hypothetical protein n=1 Tax=Actinosynnema sp. NPDC050436 TaxID=3155659 RepID=UPI00340EB09F